jgi:NIPSNAP protein
MDRRDFVGGSVAGALGSALARPQAEAAAAEGPGSPRPQLLELRRYQFRFGPMETRFADYAKGALLPALNRAGVKPVGAFTVAFGAESPAAYLLLPHASAESVPVLAGRIRADAEYQRAATAYRALPATDPPYVRRDSSLMAAFDSFPAVVAPSGPLAVPGRVFELRTYESHNENAGLKKIEMFEKGGEIAIFRRVGLAPVFFGRNVVGPRLPSLTYMLVFPDLATREKNWGVFRDDPEWAKLRATPGFANAEILTNISVEILRPTDYSSI